MQSAAVPSRSVPVAVVFSHVPGVVIDNITRAVGGRCGHLDLGIKRQELSSPPFLAIALAAPRDPSFHRDACNHRVRGALFSLISSPLGVSRSRDPMYPFCPTPIIFESSHFRSLTTILRGGTVARGTADPQSGSHLRPAFLGSPRYTRKVSRLPNQRNTRFDRRIIQRTSPYFFHLRRACIISPCIDVYTVWRLVLRVPRCISSLPLKRTCPV